MSARRQIVFSVAVIAVAVATVVLYDAAAGSAETGDEAQGHDHAAMAADGDRLDPVRLDATSARRIGVTYATAELRALRPEIRTVGIVGYDETRLADLNPRIEGWVERLHVDFTGAPVRKGEPLLEVYSPKLVTAQEELILARELVDEAADRGGERALRNARDLLASARRRLAYWDIPEDEISRIERTATPRRTLTLRAPAGGIVVEKNVVEGASIRPGMTVYKIADLSTVWVEGEVFEKDLSLMRAGQPATIRFPSYPGQSVEAVVTYVYPTVSVDSRTGRIRVELENPGMRLKPGMYADIRIRAHEGPAGVVVPRSAVLHTGERSVVFVREPDGLLVPREITTGLAAGPDVTVLSGLEAGATVVSSAGFLIDAESNLGASMAGMTDPETEDGAAAPATGGHQGH